MRTVLLTIWYSLIYTPWWVYLIAGYLIVVGIKASKTRVISFKILFIAPIIFSSMSIHTLLTAIQLSVFSIGVWAIASALGIAFGWLRIVRRQLRVDKKHLLIEVPGTWETLMTMGIIFSTKYALGYQLYLDPTLSEQTSFEFSMLAISGATTGIFIGKLFCYLYRLKTEKHSNLKK